MHDDDDLALAIEVIDRVVDGGPPEITIGWRTVRGYLRRRRRPSTLESPRVEEEPITARHHFAAALERLEHGKKRPDE